MPRQTEELHFESHQGRRSTNERFKEPSSAQFEGEKIQDALKIAQEGQGRKWHRVLMQGPRFSGPLQWLQNRERPAGSKLSQIQSHPPPCFCTRISLFGLIFIRMWIQAHHTYLPPTCPQVWSCCCPKPFWLWEKPTGAGGHCWKWHFVPSVVSSHGFLHWKKRKG